MELKGKIINFLGDSITEGANADCPENAYHQVLARKCGLKLARNYGIGGTRIAYQKEPSELEQYDKWFCSRVAEMEDDADIVVVFGGTNDYGHGVAPIGKFEDRTDDTFYGALHVLYTSLIEKYPGKPIIVMTPLHRTGEEEVHEKHGVKTTLKTYVEIIREVAQYYSLPVCDLFAMSGLQPNLPVINEMFFTDGLHPNTKGHEYLADKVATFLKNL